MRPQWLGLTDYVAAMKQQDKIVDRCALIHSFAPLALESRSAEVVLGLEHPLTITLGKRADPLKDFKVSVKVLRERGAQIVGVERGGQTTLHSPGQLVIYPIVDLRARGIRVRDYVRLLEDVTKRFLADYGITACCRGEMPGLYTIQGKIAFFGVRIKKGMSSHGVAINVHNDLSHFAMIRSCGKVTESFARMADHSVTASLEELFFTWYSYFQTGLSLTQDVNRPIVTPPIDLRI